ncbi:MAG: ATP-grasp fold amidoligase family protein [Clostridia bacterium]
MAQTVTEPTRFWKARIFLFNTMCGLSRRGLLNWVPDKGYLRVQFYLKVGRRLNLKNPTLYDDKLQWIKLYDRDPKYNVFVDKLAVRDYVRDAVGEKYLIPEIARADAIEQIDWTALPAKYVLKCTHGSSCNIVNDGTLTPEALESEKAHLPEWMGRNWFSLSREWPYKDVRPRILVEQFLESPGGGVPYDYKILCFDGQPRYIIVDIDRYTAHKRNFYDVNWVRQDIFNRHPAYDGEVKRPDSLEEMLEVARKLSKGIRHIRIDLYEVAGRVYFGEMTFFHGYGMEVFRPRAFERRLGDLIRLPEKGKG